MPRVQKAREPLRIAALELIVERGVHAAGIREISKHAGYSEAAMYRHWPNKEALVESLFREHLADVSERMTKALSVPGDLRTRIHSGAEACFRLYDEQPLVFRFVLLVQHELASTLPADLTMPHDALRAFIAQAVKAGEAEGDPDHLTPALMGIFLQTAMWVHYGRLAPPLCRYVEPVTESCMRVLGWRGSRKR